MILKWTISSLSIGLSVSEMNHDDFTMLNKSMSSLTQYPFQSIISKYSIPHKLKESPMLYVQNLC